MALNIYSHHLMYFQYYTKTYKTPTDDTMRTVT